MSVNWTRIHELEEEIGVEDFGEVVELFLFEVEAAIDGLQTDAPSESDYHFIKSSALNLGFSGLAELCARGEAEASKSGTCSVSPEMIGEAFRCERQEFAARDAK